MTTTPGLDPETSHRLLSKVRDHMKGDEEKTILWFTTSNPLLGGVQPIEMILRGRAEKLEKFIDALIADDLS